MEEVKVIIEKVKFQSIKSVIQFHAEDGYEFKTKKNDYLNSKQLRQIAYKLDELNKSNPVKPKEEE